MIYPEGVCLFWSALDVVVGAADDDCQVTVDRRDFTGGCLRCLLQVLYGKYVVFLCHLLF